MTAFLRDNPYLKQDANGREIQSSSFDMAFRGDYMGGSNLIYKGFARPGTATDVDSWQIAKLAYDGSNNVISITWPENDQLKASSEYEFIWDDRASYTYS